MLISNAANLIMLDNPNHDELAMPLRIDCGGGEHASISHGVWTANDSDLAALLNHRAMQTGLDSDADLLRDAAKYLGLDDDGDEGMLLSRAANAIYLWRADQTRDDHGRFVAEGGTPVNTAHPRLKEATKAIRRLEYARRQKVSTTPGHKALTAKLNDLRGQRRGEWRKVLDEEKAAVAAKMEKFKADAASERAKLYQQHGKTAESGAGNRLNPIGQHVPRLNEAPATLKGEPATAYLKDQPKKSNDPFDAFNAAVEEHYAAASNPTTPNAPPLQSEAAKGMVMEPKQSSYPVQTAVGRSAWNKANATGSENTRIIGRKSLASVVGKHGGYGQVTMPDVDAGRMRADAHDAPHSISKLDDGRYLVTRQPSEPVHPNSPPLQSAAAQAMPLDPTHPNAEPVRVDPSRQFGLFAKDDKGNPAEIGEKPGQANLFDVSGPKVTAVNAPASAVVGSKAANDPRNTTEMFPTKSASVPVAAMEVKPISTPVNRSVGRGPQRTISKTDTHQLQSDGRTATVTSAAGKQNKVDLLTATSPTTDLPKGASEAIRKLGKEPSDFRFVGGGQNATIVPSHLANSIEVERQGAVADAKKLGGEHYEPAGLDKVRNAHEAHDRAVAAESKAINNDGIGLKPGATKATGDHLDSVRGANPEAAAWRDAEKQEQSTSWADNTGKSEAAKNAKDVLRKGGSTSDARAAMAKRRDVDPMGLSRLSSRAAELICI